MDNLHYFAYGSNLHPLRLQERVPSAVVMGVATTAGRKLTFSKRGADSSGKCDIPATGCEGDIVYGVLYQMAAQHKAKLDAVEGKGYGYRDSRIHVRMEGNSYTPFAYLAQEGHVDPALAPFDWYKALVVQGAVYHSIPPAYTEMLENIRSIPDPDAARSAENQSLLALIRAFNQRS